MPPSIFTNHASDQPQLSRSVGLRPPSLTLDQPHGNQFRPRPTAHQLHRPTTSDPAPAPRRRLARDLENRLRRPLLRAPCPFAVATGQAALRGRSAKSLPLVSEFPTEIAFPSGDSLTRHFARNQSRPRLANFPSGNIRGPGGEPQGINRGGTKPHLATCRSIAAFARLNPFALNHFHLNQSHRELLTVV